MLELHSHLCIAFSIFSVPIPAADAYPDLKFREFSHSSVGSQDSNFAHRRIRSFPIAPH